VKSRPANHPGSEAIARSVAADLIWAETYSVAPLKETPGFFGVGFGPGNAHVYRFALLDELTFDPEIETLAREWGRLVEVGVPLEVRDDADSAFSSRPHPRCSPFLDPVNTVQRNAAEEKRAEWRTWSGSRKGSPDFHFEEIWVAHAHGEQLLLAACLDDEACRAMASTLDIFERDRTPERLLEMLVQDEDEAPSLTREMAAGIAAIRGRRLDAKLAVPLGNWPRSRPSGLTMQGGSA
jgi:hypothetical protein